MEHQHSPDEQEARKHFFINYAPADIHWAEWLAWHLEKNGYSVILPKWDFLPGSNSILELHKAVTQTERTIAVLSPHYVNILLTLPDWTVTYKRDITGEQRLLLPVRVQPCEAEGLLSPIIPIDLAGEDEQAALNMLLDGIKGERAKPSHPPKFPGVKPRVIGFQLESNPLFVGRENVLKLVYTTLHTGSIVAVTHALTSSGESVGKTEVTREYVYRYQYDYSVILWVQDNPFDNSSTPLTRSLRSIIDALELPEKDGADHALLIAALQRWLATNRDWLLILDGVKDPQTVVELLPPQRQGHVLLTTRERAMAAIAQLVELDDLTAEDKALAQRLSQLVDAALHSPSGEQIHLGPGETTIGSASDNTIVRNDPSVSPHHAVITLKDGNYYITDLKGSSGTFVNGQRLPPEIPHPLQQKDSIQIGKILLAYASDATQLTFTSVATTPSQSPAPMSPLPRLDDPQEILRRAREQTAPDTWQVFRSEKVSFSDFRDLVMGLDVAGMRAFILHLFLMISGGSLIIVLAEDSGITGWFIFLIVLVCISIAIAFFAVLMVKAIQQAPAISRGVPYADALLVLTPEGFVEYIDAQKQVDAVCFADLVGMQMQVDEDEMAWLDLVYRDGRNGQWSQRAHFGPPVDIAQYIIDAFMHYTKRHTRLHP